MGPLLRGALVVLLHVMTAPAGVAQELEPLEPGDPTNAMPVPMDPAVEPGYWPDNTRQFELFYEQVDADGRRPPSLLSGVDYYIRSGLVVPLGGGTFEDTVHPGWTIQGGFRQPLFGTDHGLKTYYLDIGGDFSENHSNGNAVVTSGTLIPNTGPSTFLDEFFSTQVRHLRRGSGHLALGFVYYPEAYNPAGEQRVWVNVRGGGRLGHLHARFRQTPTEALQDAIDALGPTTTFDLASDVDDTDIFGGLFGSAGIGVTYWDVHFGRAYLGNVSVGIDVEIGHDWYDLGDFSRNDIGFLTFTSLLTLVFTR